MWILTAKNSESGSLPYISYPWLQIAQSMWEYDQLLHQCMTRPFPYRLRNRNVGLNNKKPTAVQMQVLLANFLNLQIEGNKKKHYKEKIAHIVTKMVLQ